MSIEAVREYLRRYGAQDRVMEFEASSATVAEAAAAVSVDAARIAKTLSFENQDRCLVIVAAGDARIDNTKFKARFAMKAKMLSPEEALARTGYAIGGVSPFALKPGVDVYLDCSMKRFETVFPACGSANSAIELSLPELELFSCSKEWVDVCKGWAENA